MAGAQMSLEQPRNTLSWNEPFVQFFVRDLHLDLVVVAVCHWRAHFFKRWIFGTTFRPLQQLQGVSARRVRVRSLHSWPRATQDGADIHSILDGLSRSPAFVITLNP